jgi:hypothetical protein
VIRRAFLLLAVLLCAASSPTHAQVSRFRVFTGASPAGGGSFAAHGSRLWLTPTVVSRVTTKQGASDADWLTIKGIADAGLTNAPAKCTITSISNANPAVVTCAETVPFDTTSAGYFGGGTGGWAAINEVTYNGIVTPTIITKTGTNTFSVQQISGGVYSNLNSTGFGTFSGQNITVFIFDGTASTGYTPWGQYGGGWPEEMRDCALLYRITGTVGYRTCALTRFDLMTSYGVAGLIGPTSIDSGRAGTTITINLPITYDWLYSSLSSGQKTAAVTTLNLWVNWTFNGNGLSGPAFGADVPNSNYWELANTFVGASYYATVDENGSAATLAAILTANAALLANTFVAPDPTLVYGSSTATKGAWYGGQDWIGFNYGGNDIARHVKFFELVKDSTGSDPTNARTYAQTWTRAVIHELRPDRYRSPSWGRYPGHYYNVFNRQEDMLLATYLTGTTEGAWAAWQYAHTDYATPGIIEGSYLVLDIFDRLLFFDSGLTQTDYTATEPTAKFVDGIYQTLFWRKDWTTSADYAYARLSPAMISGGDVAKDSGHIEISRGSDPLLVQSAHWKGGVGDGLAGSPENEYYDPSMANTLFFWDGGLSAGLGNCFNQGVGGNYDGCQQLYGKYVQANTKIGTSSAWVFGENDLAGAYDGPSNTPAQRTLNYLFRAFFALGDGTYVVFDRAKSTSASHTKKELWHLPQSPTIDAAAQTATITQGSSKLTIKTLLPVNASLQSVQNIGSSNYHVEVSDPSPVQAFTGLNVFYAQASGGSPPTITRLTTIDDNFEGLQIADTNPKVVALGKGVTDNGSGSFSSTTYTSAAFTTTHSGTAAYWVKGMASGSYTVRVNGSSTTSCTVGADGICNFSTTAGDVTVN